VDAMVGTGGRGARGGSGKQALTTIARRPPFCQGKGEFGRADRVSKSYYQSPKNGGTHLRFVSGNCVGCSIRKIWTAWDLLQ
jgi:hypothetical protein